MRIFRLFFLLAFLFLLEVSVVKPVSAATSFTHLNTATGSNGGFDAVNWSPGYPIMVDAYGHIFSILQNNSSGYYFSWSNDKGATWSELIENDVHNRPTAAYDPIHDKVHVFYGDDTSASYLRFSIKRDKDYNITSFEQDDGVGVLNLDIGGGGCTVATFNNPTLLFKDNGSNGILAAFWSVTKTCGGVSKTQTRAAMRTLSNTSSDGVVGNWKALNGVSDADASAFDALSDFNILYTSTNSDAPYQQGSMIRGGSGGKSEDIYYFNVDHDDTNGFRRLSWNGGSQNWSGSWTSRVTFGGNVNDSQGYGLKRELMTKPVYDPINDRVYIGIARWLDNTNGDTNSLFYVDNTDAITLAANVYSAGGAHCLYPTLDITVNPLTGEIYTFYDISTNAGTCGDASYKVYNGTTLGSAQPFWVAAQSVDIPIVYQDPVNAQFLFLFRVNNLVTPGSPPHDIYYGVMDVPGLSPSPTPTVVITSPHTESTVVDFDRTCAAKSSTEVTNFSGGEVANASDFYSDFAAPTLPYSSLFSPWTTGSWTTGNFTPTLNGTLTVPGGYYAITSTNYDPVKSLGFRARFGNNTFQHIGWVDSTGFFEYAIVSTRNQTSNLYLRVESGGGESNVDLGTGPVGNEYLGHYHSYRIRQSGGHTLLDIDGVQAADIADAVSGSFTVIASNNDTSLGSALDLDWIQVQNYATNGTYTSCALDSSTADAVWGNASYTADASPGSVLIESRTGDTLGVWSSWSTVTSGAPLLSSPGRFLQYRATLAGTSTAPSTLSDLTLNFTAPPSPSPSPSPSPVPSPSPSVAPSSSPAPSNSSSGTSEPSKPNPPQGCSATVPGTKAPGLYAAIAESDTSIRLYFSAGDGPFDHYALAFGTSSGSQDYGSDNIGGNEARTYLVNSLTPNQKYYFKVRSGNGCAPGNWSNEIFASTKGLFNTQSSLQITNSELSGSGTPSNAQDTESTATGGTSTTDQQSSKVDLNVKVVDPNQKPVADATVSIESTKLQTTTDQSGLANFQNVNPGTYTVQVDSNGQKGEQSLSIKGDQAEQDLTITVAQQGPRISPIILIVGGILILLLIIGAFFIFR